jgi:acylphosphatase
VPGVKETTASPQRAVTLRIEGNVQGVGFRAWTQKLAGQLNLRGWVRNRRDGSVEALFCGPAMAVNEAVARCRIGPRSAKVTGVTLSEPGPAVAGSSFDILPGV